MVSDAEARRILFRDGISLGPLSASFTDAETRIPRGHADFVAELTWGGQTHRFVVEYKRGGTPREIEAALAQIRRYVKGQPGLHPMIIAPYLSDQAIRRVLDEEVSGVDLSGNAGIIVPGTWLIVLSGKPNRYPSSAPIKAIYGGTSSLVARVMLNRPRYRMVREVQEEIESRGGAVSIGTVSKVLKGLEEDLVVSREPEIKLLDPGRLLDRLRDSYVPPQVRDRRLGRLDLGRGTYEALVRNASGAGARLVGSAEARYVIAPRTGPLQIYTTSIEDVLEGVPMEPGQRFANVEFLETDDPRPYFDARWEDGFPWAPPLQVYLDLATGGKREKEAAEQLRDDLIRFQTR